MNTIPNGSGKRKASQAASSTQRLVKNMKMPPNSFINAENLRHLQQQGKVQVVDENLIAAWVQQQQEAAKGRKEIEDDEQIDDEEPFDEEYLDYEDIVDGEDLQNKDGQGVEFEEPDDIELPAVTENPQLGSHNPQVCCPECRAEWKRDVETIFRRLHEILARDNAQPAWQGENYPLLPPLPFTELERLQQFDRDIQENADMREQFITKITSIGGKNLQKRVKFAMEAVMSDALCKDVVWVLGPAVKPKLSTYTFPKLIVQIVRTVFKEQTIQSIEAKIAEWLRRGGDRVKAAAEKQRGRDK